MTSRSWLTSTVLLVLFAGGCGEKGPPPGAPFGEPVPVTGTVHLADGNPLKGGIIVFTPVMVEVGSKVRYPGEAFVDGKGHFTAGFGGSGNGLVPGEYRVSIKRREIGELRESNVTRVPKEFTDAGSSKLTASVEGKATTLDIILK